MQGFLDRGEAFFAIMPRPAIAAQRGAGSN